MSIDKFGQNLAVQVLIKEGEKPQFESDDLSDLQEKLDDRGVLYTVERIPANELTVPSEGSLDKGVVKEKADKIKEKEEVRPAVISKDYDIIDGRHEVRALGELKGEDHKVPVLRVHLPTSEAMGMLNDVQTQLNEQEGEMDVVVVFSGRFQPFHRGHYKAYEHLVNRFGRNKVYLGTSNKVDKPRSPFTFDQKKKIITSLFDVPHEHVVEVKNPYAPKEVLDNYDSEGTAYVAAVSKKDEGRLLGSDYFDAYEAGKDLEGYDDSGYVYTTPMAGFTIQGEEISGTNIRETFRNEDIPEEEKKEFFKYIYGEFNQSIYDLMTKRLKEGRVLSDKLIEQFLLDKRFDRALNRTKSVLQEISTGGKVGIVDDGPVTWYSEFDDYQEANEELARLFGFDILNYIADYIDDDFKIDGQPFDSFYPTGIGPKGAVEGDIEDVYLPYSEAMAEAAGYEILDYMGATDEDYIASLYHDPDKNIADALGEPETAQDVEDEAEGLEDEPTEGPDREEELQGDDEEEKAGSDDYEGDEEITDVDEQEPINENRDLSKLIENVKKKLNGDRLLQEGGGAGHSKKANVDMVKCKECEKEFEQIQYRHLEYKHNMTMDEYKEKYPNANLVSEEVRQKISDNNPMHNKENRKKVSDNNPMKKEKNRKKISEALSGRCKPHMKGEKNPAKRDDVRKKISEGVKESYENNPSLRELRAKTVGKSTFSEQYKEKMYESGEWIRPEEKDKFEQYKEKVRRYTEKTLRENKSKFKNLDKRGRNEYHVDHEYSIQSAFQNDIKPEVVSHHSNLRLIPHHINESKGSKNSKDKKQFIKDVVNTKDGRKLLQAGGGAGHMNHPFEDLDLTFGDLKNMVNLAFEGNLDIEEQPVEKVDGQNLMISWKNGDLVAARNKGHLRNFGEDAMDLRDLVNKFEGRGAIREAFEYAFRDLSIALSEVSDKKLEEVFQEGRKWMSLEVIYPAAKNVVDYGESFIVFHGLIEHDENGNAIDFKKDPAYRLADLVEEVDQKAQDEFEILSPPEVELPNIQLEDLRSELVGNIEDYMSEYDMSNSNRVMDWHEEWWEEFIREKADEFDYDIPEHVVAGLIKRWAWGNKSGKNGYGLRTFKSEVDHEDFKSWAREFDKNDYRDQFKENIRPIENVFLRLGTEVLKRIETVLTTDPEHTQEDIQKQLADVRAQLEDVPADSGKVEKLQKEMSRLESAGGIDEIAALEGIVFQYDGKVFKLTGQFSSLNQIIGMMKYDR